MPANEIVGLLPGELFVHRNIANVVVHSDLNCLSVMQFAVEVLQVAHIIVCGHYGCSGVSSALQNQRVGLADNWLRHIQDVHAKHDAKVAAIVDLPQRIDRLCELNVIEQVANVCQTTVVQDAWDRGQDLAVHGWVYGLEDGLVRDLRYHRHGSGEGCRCVPGGAGLDVARRVSAVTLAPRTLNVRRRRSIRRMSVVVACMHGRRNQPRRGTPHPDRAAAFHTRHVWRQLLLPVTTIKTGNWDLAWAAGTATRRREREANRDRTCGPPRRAK